jgi:hypothetical protein
VVKAPPGKQIMQVGESLLLSLYDTGRLSRCMSTCHRENREALLEIDFVSIKLGH